MLFSGIFLTPKKYLYNLPGSFLRQRVIALSTKFSKQNKTTPLCQMALAALYNQMAVID